MEEARQSFAKGMKDVEKGNLADARDRFEHAYALVPSADILWNLALTEKKLGRARDALVHLRAYAADPIAKPERVTAARAMEPELLAKVGRIVTIAKVGTVVTLDGAMMAAGDTAFVDAGAHSVEFRTSDSSKSVVVNAEAGVLTEVTQPTSDSVTRVPLAVMEKPAFVTGTPSTDKKSSFPWLTVGLGVGAGVAVLGGVYLGLQASDKLDDRERAWSAVQNQRSGCKPGDALCDKYTETKHDAALLQTGEIAAFTVGGLLGGAAIASWLMKREGDRALTVAVQPGGFSAQGTF